MHSLIAQARGFPRRTFTTMASLASPASPRTPIEIQVYLWDREFEGHTIQVASELTKLDAVRAAPTGAPCRTSPLLCVETPTGLAPGHCPWEFAQRFLQHEWRLQRQKHRYPADMLFSGSVCCVPRQLMRFYYEDFPRQPGPPRLWSHEDRVDFPLAGGQLDAAGLFSLDPATLGAVFSFSDFMREFSAKNCGGDKGENPMP